MWTGNNQPVSTSCNTIDYTQHQRPNSSDAVEHYVKDGALRNTFDGSMDHEGTRQDIGLPVGRTSSSWHWWFRQRPVQKRCKVKIWRVCFADHPRTDLVIKELVDDRRSDNFTTGVAEASTRRVIITTIDAAMTSCALDTNDIAAELIRLN